MWEFDNFIEALNGLLFEESPSLVSDRLHK